MISMPRPPFLTLELRLTVEPDPSPSSSLPTSPVSFLSRLRPRVRSLLAFRPASSTVRSEKAESTDSFLLCPRSLRDCCRFGGRDERSLADSSLDEISRDGADKPRVDESLEVARLWRSPFSFWREGRERVRTEERRMGETETEYTECTEGYDRDSKRQTKKGQDTGYRTGLRGNMGGGRNVEKRPTRSSFPSK